MVCPFKKGDSASPTITERVWDGRRLSGSQTVGRDGCERPLFEREARASQQFDLEFGLAGLQGVHAAGQRFAAGDERLDHRCIDEDAKRVVGFELWRERKLYAAASDKMRGSIDQQFPDHAAPREDADCDLRLRITERDMQFSAERGQRLLGVECHAAISATLQHRAVFRLRRRGSSRVRRLC